MARIEPDEAVISIIDEQGSQRGQLIVLRLELNERPRTALRARKNDRSRREGIPEVTGQPILFRHHSVP